MRTSLTIDDIDPLPVALPLSQRSYAEAEAKLDRIVGSIRPAPALRIVGELAQKCAHMDRVLSHSGMLPEAPGFKLLTIDLHLSAAPVGLPTETAPDSEGWITWNGCGECPVGIDAMVDLRFAGRNGDERVRAGDKWWEHRAKPGDIIAYRLSKPEAPKADRPVAGASGQIAAIHADGRLWWAIPRDGGFQWIGPCNFRHIGKPRDLGKVVAGGCAALQT